MTATTDGCTGQTAEVAPIWPESTPITATSAVRPLKASATALRTATSAVAGPARDVTGDRDEEVRLVTEGVELPGRQGDLERQPSCRQIREEVVERVAAAGTVREDNPPVLGEVVPKVLENGDASARREEPQHVPGGEDEVKGLGDACSWQVEEGEVAHEPGAVREIRCGVVDEGWVDIDSNDGVPARGQPAPDSTRAAPGIEDSRTTGHHRIEHPRFAVEVVPFRGEAAPTSGVAM